MTVRYLRFQASKDSPPTNEFGLIRCRHGKLLGVYVRRGMRCHRPMFRLCR